MRRLLLLLVFAVGLAVPMVALADGAPDPTAVCKAEYLQLGPDAFRAKYGVVEAFGNCLAQHGATTTTTATTPTTTAAPSGDDPASLCKAEYLKLGPDAFKAKYGNEAYGNCLAQHGATTTTTTTATTTTATPSGDDPASLCKAEYLKLGQDAFKAEYGNEAYGNCLAQHGASHVTTTTVTTTPKPPDPSAGAGDVARLLCTAEGAKLGKDAFTTKYGPKEPFGNCLKTQLPAAQAIVTACKASANDSKDAFKSCVAAAVGPTRRR